MYIVDTNIISEASKARPSAKVIEWLIAHEQELYLTAITIKELYYGMLRMDAGKRQTQLCAFLEGITETYQQKTLSFSSKDGIECARLHALAIKRGHTPDIEDLMIAAICKGHGATLVTRNVKDFDYLDIPTLNPFDGS